MKRLLSAGEIDTIGRERAGDARPASHRRKATRRERTVALHVQWQGPEE